MGVKVSVGVNVSVEVNVSVGVRVSVGVDVNVEVGVSVHESAMAVKASAVAVACDSADGILQEAIIKIIRTRRREFFFI